jgi:hypothetical protein
MKIIQGKYYFAILIIIFFYFCINASAQMLSPQLELINNKKPENIFDKHNVNTKENYIFLLLNCGYHSGNDPNAEWGFESGLITSGTAGVVIANKWEFGLTIDYWKSANENYPLSNEIVYRREYKAHGVNLMFKYRFPIYRDIIGIKIGMGLGNYRISAKSFDGFYNTDQYLNLNPILNMEVKPISFLSLEAELTYHYLMSFEKRNHFFKFTVGPKLFLILN